MTDGEGIVISGFSGRFPSSESISEFEHNLYHSVDMVTADDSRWPVGTLPFRLSISTFPFPHSLSPSALSTASMAKISQGP